MLRALAREPDTGEALFAEFAKVQGGHALLDAEVAAIKAQLTDKVDLEKRARYVVERLALALQAATLVRAGNALVADSFCQSRLGILNGKAFGTLAATAPAAQLIERAF